MKAKRMDHVGIVVSELGAAIEFFHQLGFVVQGEMTMQGKSAEFAAKVSNLQNVDLDMAMMSLPDNDTTIELTQYRAPKETRDLPLSHANTPGIRHLCLEVDNVEKIVAHMQKKGYDLVGTMENYQDIYKLCYIRGPENIIVELAEKLA